MKRFFIVNGPNMNFLGIREPAVYGTRTLGMINETISEHAAEIGAVCEFMQFNSEGGIIDCLQRAHAEADGVVLNAGAYTHYSFAIRDCIASISKPVVEVHLSNVQAREDYRKNSVISGVCRGSIAGFGELGYILALDALMKLTSDKQKRPGD